MINSTKIKCLSLVFFLLEFGKLYSHGNFSDFQTVGAMKRTIENIKDPLFRFFEREVNAGGKLLADVRRDLQDVLQVCVGDKKPTNHHRVMMADLAKGRLQLHFIVDYSSAK